MDDLVKGYGGKLQKERDPNKGKSGQGWNWDKTKSGEEQSQGPWGVSKNAGAQDKCDQMMKEGGVNPP